MPLPPLKERNRTRRGTRSALVEVLKSARAKTRRTDTSNTFQIYLVLRQIQHTNESPTKRSVGGICGKAAEPHTPFLTWRYFWGGIRGGYYIHTRSYGRRNLETKARQKGARAAFAATPQSRTRPFWRGVTSWVALGVDIIFS